MRYASRLPVMGCGRTLGRPAIGQHADELKPRLDLFSRHGHKRGGSPHLEYEGAILWVGGVQHDWIVADTEDGVVIMPPIPAALDRLSPALETLIRHFPVDRDALAVAASVSQASKPERIPIAAVLERLSVSEMRALLARVTEGGGPGVMSELNRLTFAPVKAPDNQLMSCREFAIKVLKVREVRHKKEAEEAVVKREREAELRKQHLDSVMQRAESIWSGLDLLMHQKITSAYDRAAAQLQELRNAYAQAGEIGAFQRRLRESEFSTRTAPLCCAGSRKCDHHRARHHSRQTSVWNGYSGMPRPIRTNDSETPTTPPEIRCCQAR